MSSEEPHATDMRGDMVEDGLCDGYTVVGGCATSEFIEDYEGSTGCLGEDLFCFGELDEEGRL